MFSPSLLHEKAPFPFSSIIACNAVIVTLRASLIHTGFGGEAYLRPSVIGNIPLEASLIALHPLEWLVEILSNPFHWFLLRLPPIQGFT